MLEMMTFVQRFGGDAPALVGWNAHDPIWLGRPRGDLYYFERDAVLPVHLPTGRSADYVGTSVEVSRELNSQREFVPVEEGTPLYASANALIGPKLNHLPHRLVRAYRASEHPVEMRRIEKE